MRTNVETHRQIVQSFLDSKAVDFAAAGKVIAELGPSVSLMDEPGDFFCGTMRAFFHCYRLGPGTLGPVFANPIEDLGALRRTVDEL